MATDTSAFSLFGNETPEMVLERLKKEQHAALISALEGANKGNRKEQMGTALGAGLGLLLRNAFGDKPEDDPAYKRSTQNQDVQDAFSNASTAARATGGGPQMDIQDQNAVNGDMLEQSGVPMKPVEQQVSEHAMAAAGSGSDNGTKAMIQGYDAAITKAMGLNRPDIARQLIMERTKLAADYEEKQANLAHLYATTNQANAQTDEAKAKTDQIKEGGQPAEYQQLVQRNEVLRQRATNLPEGSVAAQSITRQIKENEDRMAKLAAITGTTEFDPSRATRSALEKDIIANGKTMDNLRAIHDNFKADYLKYGTQIKQFGIGQASKIGFPLSAELSRSNDEYVAFKRDNSKLLNDTIREVTGATVGNTQESLLQPSEAGRIRNQVPNEGDTPTGYAQKYNEVYWMTQAAMARSQDALDRKDLSILKRPLSAYTSAVDQGNFIGQYNDWPGAKKDSGAPPSIVDKILSAKPPQG